MFFLAWARQMNRVCTEININGEATNRQINELTEERKQQSSHYWHLENSQFNDIWENTKNTPNDVSFAFCQMSYIFHSLCSAMMMEKRARVAQSRLKWRKKMKLGSKRKKKLYGGIRKRLRLWACCEYASFSLEQHGWNPNKSLLDASPHLTSSARNG